ncbi:MAG: hypothetical protein Q7S00_01500, partial [bacterium]|nr:hypothetical protein [bacterium]
AQAKEETPQNFSLEFKGGIWVPQGSTVKSFIGKCCHPTGGIEFGYLWHSMLGVEAGVGLSIVDGFAQSAAGAVSQDKFTLLLLPMKNSLTFRGDFFEDQILVPYVKGGMDYVYYKESLQGTGNWGIKTGFHGTAGLQFLMEWIDPLTHYLETEVGVNDVYFTLEGQYAKIDSFGKAGLDLSGWTLTGGLLFEF